MVWISSVTTIGIFAQLSTRLPCNRFIDSRNSFFRILVVLGRNNPSLYTVNGRPLYVHLNGLAIVLLK
jgi:hypothetical protein